ncbi:MAG: HAD-IA family hydrolase [Gammaproteobacteria bacterium]|nr:HAD-IA family hydrolase [Gammaproteobacteria bacterium]
MHYKLVVFDWDGTLMDSEAQIISCMQSAFTDLQLQPPSRDQVRNIIGLGLREAVSQLHATADEAMIERLFERYRHHFFAEHSPKADLFPGVEACLEELSQAGYLLAVATGKGRRGLDLVLDQTGLGDYFIATRCADETFSKPHPQMLQELIDFAGVSATEAVMIGDTEYDLQMAINAGSPSIAVSYGVHTTERLLRFNPLACLDAIDQLPACMHNLPPCSTSR